MLMRNDHGDWAQTLGGFGIRARGDAFAPMTVVAHAIRSARRGIVERIARRYVELRIAAEVALA